MVRESASGALNCVPQIIFGADLSISELRAIVSVELSPFSPEVRKHLGEVLVKQGKLVEAAEQWDRALAFIFPDRTALEKRLGELRVRIAKEQAVKADSPAAPPAASAPPDDEEDEE